MSAPAPDHPRTTVGVIGAGAWGTALAIHAARAGHAVQLYAREAEVVASINDPAVRENTAFLKGFKVPAGLVATSDMPAMLAASELLLLVVPTPFVAATAAALAPHLDAGRHILVSCTKGILTDTLETPADILARVLPAAFQHRVAFLSGPSFAAEVAAEAPTAVTIAAADPATGKAAQAFLSSRRFRCYYTDDVTGVELGGALKNVLAIACGISDGLALGCNARAALITRGLGELTRIAVARGGHPLTSLGLAGVGDLVLTCTGDLSRNRTVGMRLGRGESLASILDSMNAVAEGVLTSKAAAALAAKEGVEAPIVHGIHAVIHEGADPVAVVEELMTRALGDEVDASVRAAARKG
jgi:glycerol-3-phosphate dehydrogenase (NAD(P)+)